MVAIRLNSAGLLYSPRLMRIKRGESLVTEGIDDMVQFMAIYC